MSKNAEGWIRHRGGKCPVDVFTIVDVMLRCKHEESGIEALDAQWGHCNHPDDVMRYRLHKPDEQQAPFIEAVQAFNALAKVPQLDGPAGWRDRIAEIDVEVQARTVEREELVQKLAIEGFALIGRVIEPVEDMSDWRNWKVGDLIEMLREKSWADMTDGKLYRLIKAGVNGFSFADDIDEVRECFERTAGDYAKDFKWHSRPSA